MVEFISLLHSLIVPKVFDISYQVAVFIVLIGILVAVHEFGHFLAAKMCGVGVIKFSIGFGPVICKKQFGETIYQLSWIPLGGFVRLVGDIPDPITGGSATDEAVRDKQKDVEAENFSPEIKAMIADKKRWFIEKGFWARSAIVFAGPFFNLLLAFVVYTFAALIYGEGYVETKAIIGAVSRQSPAEQAGIKEEDQVLKVGNTSVATWKEMSAAIFNATDEQLALEIRRNEEVMSLTVSPKQGDLEDPLTGKVRSGNFIGVTPKILKRPIPVLYAPVAGAIATFNISYQTVKGLYKMITGKVSAKHLAGPIFIFGEASHQAKKGFESFMYFLAVLSISLGIVNLLPVPILDGGHLLFFIVEAIIGPISMRKKEFAQQIGLALILTLMVFVIHNDIANKSRREPESDIKWRDKQSSSSSASEAVVKE